LRKNFILRTSKFAALPKICGNLFSYKDDFASENFRYNVITKRSAAAEEKEDKKCRLRRKIANREEARRRIVRRKLVMKKKVRGR
jgi:hypothetical protein